MKWSDGGERHMMLAFDATATACSAMDTIHEEGDSYSKPFARDEAVVTPPGLLSNFWIMFDSKSHPSC
jgi:hypothetical protein